jgi:cellobiose-specific phosphotransferase system component IIA
LTPIKNSWTLSRSNERIKPEEFMTAIKGIVTIALALGLALAATFAPAQSPRAKALEAAVAEIKAAEQALREAEERQKQAVEPLPGERAANVDGRSRLGPEYFERQRAQEAEVEAARARLEEAHRRRNQLRD